MRSICLCFLPAVTLTASVDCCCTPLFHTTTPLPQPKVPDTQQLNKNTQISHVDHGKHFQLPRPGQLELAKVTCAVLRSKPLLHKLCCSNQGDFSMTNLPFPCVISNRCRMHIWAQNPDKNVILASCHYSKNTLNTSYYPKFSTTFLKPAVTGFMATWGQQTSCKHNTDILSPFRSIWQTY